MSKTIATIWIDTSRLDKVRFHLAHPGNEMYIEMDYNEFGLIVSGHQVSLPITDQWKADEQVLKIAEETKPGRERADR